MDWSNELRPLLDIAFHEGGNGLLWTAAGALIGLIASIIIIAVAARYAFKKKWPTEASWGEWCRWGLLAYCIFTIPTTFIATGAGWGVISAVKSAVHSEQLIEKFTVLGTSDIVAEVYVRLQSTQSKNELSDSERQSLVSEYVNHSETINLLELEDARDELKIWLTEGVAHIANQKFGNTQLDESSKIVTYISEKVWTWFVESEVDEILGHVDAVIIDLRKRDLSIPNEVTVEEVCFSIGTVHIKPLINREISKFQKATIILSLLQVLLLVGVPVVIIHLIARQIKRKTDTAVKQEII